MDVLLPRNKIANKGDYKKTLIIGGSLNYPGSVLLCAEGALASGTGYVTLGILKEIYNVVACKIKEVTYEVFEKFYNPVQLDELFRKYSCIVFGNGIKNNVDSQRTLEYILYNYRGKLLIDATGLDVLKSIGLLLMIRFKGKLLLTPHLKEYERLFNINTNDKCATDLIDDVALKVQKFDITILLKDFKSVVIGSTGNYIINNGNPGLAKAGSGDVLAGFIGGLLSFSDAEVDQIAYFGHTIFSLASEELAKETSLHSFVISDVAKKIGVVLKNKGL